MSEKVIKINAIVAMCHSNFGIGLNGSLPWRLPKDLKFFAQITKFTKDKTKSNCVLIGRKTWFSLPNLFRPLPNRINIIISNTINSKADLLTNQKSSLDDVHICKSYNDAIDFIFRELNDKVESIYVIGGSQLYQSAFDYKYFNRLYLTRVYLDVKCDTFLQPPNFLESFKRVTEIDEKNDENLKGFEINKIEKEGEIEYCFEIYEKK
jgi:dihydrofolate reductase